MDDLEQKSTAILTHFVHHVLKPGNAYQFAIDYTNDPYYGVNVGIKIPTSVGVRIPTCVGIRSPS